MPSIDGLVSGLSTSDIIRQLMQIERQPQLRMESQKSLVQRSIDAYRGVSSLISAAKTAAETLLSDATWSASKATSSDSTRVAVASSAGATPSSMSFTVERLAAGGVSATDGTVASTADVVATAGSTIRLLKGTTATSISVGDGSLASIVTAINGSGAGVTASAVEVSPGAYKLHLASSTTGAGTGIAIDDGVGGNPFAASTLGAVQQLVAGQDSLLQVGGATGYSVTRSSNTITDLMAGVTLTLQKADSATPVTVEVSGDPEATADKVGKAVEALNAALADIKRLTSYDATNKKAALLTGDGLLRGIQQRLAGAVSGGGGSLTSVSGVSLQRDGTVAFDKAKFLKAFAEDPTGTRSALAGDAATPGMAERLRAVANAATSSETSSSGPGLLTSAVKSREAEVRGYTKRIEGFETRLDLRETTLRRQFSAMERALGQMQQQSQWLAGQIAGLPRGGG